jgi:hypothetical protein
MTEAYFVLFEEGPPADWRRAARAVAAASHSLPLADATRACRRGQGLIPIGLRRAEAEAVAAGLSQAGFPARAVGGAELMPPPRARTVPLAEPHADGLHLPIDLLGTMRVLPWPYLRILNVAYVRPTGGAAPLIRHSSVKPRPSRPEPREMPEEADRDLTDDILTICGNVAEVAASWWFDLPVGSIVRFARFAERLKEEQIQAADPELAIPPPAKVVEPEMWLELCGLEPRIRIRIREALFRYDYLDDRRSLSSRQNFRLLVRDVVSLAPHLAKTGVVGDVLANERIDESEALDESEHELTLLALLTRDAVVGLPR